MTAVILLTTFLKVIKTQGTATRLSKPFHILTGFIPDIAPTYPAKVTDLKTVFPCLWKNNYNNSVTDNPSIPNSAFLPLLQRTS